MRRSACTRRAVVVLSILVGLGMLTSLKVRASKTGKWTGKMAAAEQAGNAKKKSGSRG